MLRCFSSEIDHRCGQNVVSTNNCSCCSLYVWFILYIVVVLWESYLTKQLQKKKLHMGCSWVCHSGRGERKVDIYIYIYIYRKSASQFSRGTVLNTLKQSRINIKYYERKKRCNYISRQACSLWRVKRFTKQACREM